MRAFAAFTAVILLAGLIGAMLAYPAYELTSTFAAWPFHRVYGRIAMLALALALVWLCRRLALVERADFGYGLRRPRFLRVAALWGAIGIATAGLGAAFLLLNRLRVPDPQFAWSLRSTVHVLVLALTSAAAVALLEETVMRGAMQTAVARESWPLIAVLLIAPLFALLHFFAKASIPAGDVGFGSGFTLLARSFAPLAHPGLVFDAFLSWLAVGLVLGLTRALTGNIAAAIGLHAGWVVVLRLLQETTVRGSDPALAIWVGRFDGLLGYWLLPWAACIAAAIWLARSHWVAYARGD